MNRLRKLNVGAGISGGLIALIVGGVLLASGLLGAGTRQVVQTSASQTRPVAATARSNTDVGQIYRHTASSVVYIEASLGRQGTASGSGFVLDREGRILTNEHVVEGQSSVKVRFGAGGRLLPAKVVGADAGSDLAVLKIDPSQAKLTPLKLADSSKVAVGDEAIAIGNPFGFDRTVTTGIVSAVGRTIEAPNNLAIGHVIQTDASINPGNSGGPLLNSAGEVIGVTSQIATSGGSNGSTGIGFAVPSNTAKSIIPRLEAA